MDLTVVDYRWIWRNFVQSHIHSVHVSLAVTCHLHFWQNDWDLLGVKHQVSYLLSYVISVHLQGQPGAAAGQQGGGVAVDAAHSADPWAGPGPPLPALPRVSASRPHLQGEAFVLH